MRQLALKFKMLHQGWKTASLEYNDLVFKQCGNNDTNISIDDLNQCVLNQTYSQKEMIPSTLKGTGSQGNTLKHYILSD